MTAFPTSVEAAAATSGVLRAGSTDLSELRRLGVSLGDLVDLRDVPGLDAVTFAEGVLTIGARVRIADLAAHPESARAPAVRQAAGGLATPQIRAVATVAGNLLQRNRCWYFRNRELTCHQKGGQVCLARAGHADRHAVFDAGAGCANVHASTLAMVFLLHDAEVDVLGAPSRTVAALLGDGSDSTRDHALEPGALITAIRVPVLEGERGGYMRAAQRAFAEWPAVEAGARLVVVDGLVSVARVALGAVGRVPRRLPLVEAALVGGPATPEAFARAAALASTGASPLPGSAWKLPLLAACVEDALALALEVA